MYDNSELIQFHTLIDPEAEQFALGWCHLGDVAERHGVGQDGGSSDHGGVLVNVFWPSSQT